MKKNADDRVFLCSAKRGNDRFGIFLGRGISAQIRGKVFMRHEHLIDRVPDLLRALLLIKVIQHHAR